MLLEKNQNWDQFPIYIIPPTNVQARLSSNVMVHRKEQNPWHMPPTI